MIFRSTMCGMDNKKLLTNELENASKEDSETNGQPKYDKFNAEAEITKDFKISIGMEFTSGQRFKDVVRELNVLNGRKIKFTRNGEKRVRAVCWFNQKCAYNVYVSIAKKTNTFRVRKLHPMHTCGMVLNFKSSRSKWVKEVFVKHNINQEPKKRGRPKVNTLSNVKPNEAAKRKTKRRRDACYKKTEELEQQQLEVLVDGVEPLNQNQEVSADDDMLAKNTFVEPISAMNHVPSAADPNPVPSYEKKRKKKVTRKLDLKMVRRTSNRLRTLAFKKVYDGPGRDAASPIVINDDDYDDDDDDDDDDNEINDPKVGSCMHALRSWDGISKSLKKFHSSCFD